MPMVIKEVDAMESTATASASQMVMDLLARHVPLSLLVDLALPEGPWSLSIYETEHPGPAAA